MALDCLNQKFTAKDVSYGLAQKTLRFVNNFELAEDLHQTIQGNLGKDYFEARYGGKEAEKDENGLSIDAARQVLEARDKAVRFKGLEELEALVGNDRFMDLVNSLKVYG
jgi:hypothetical protein